MTEKKKREKEIIIIRLTLLESFLSDVSTFLTMAAMIGLGVFLESSAMQWVGAILCMGLIAAKTRAWGKNNTRTLSQARAFLDELEKAEKEG